MSTTRYVTWSLHTKSRASLKAMLSRARALSACAVLALLHLFITAHVQCMRRRSPMACLVQTHMYKADLATQFLSTGTTVT